VTWGGGGIFEGEGGLPVHILPSDLNEKRK